MPHIIVEHSRLGTTSEQLETVCRALYEAFAAHGAIPHPETLKIRTVAADHLYFASGHTTYAHATIWLLPGRTDEIKRDLAEMTCRVMHDALPDLGHLSADCQDLGAGYSKMTRD